MTSGTRHVRLVVTGRVQGVCYRASMQDEARRLGVHGWVRNRADGAVEAEAEGATEAVGRLIVWTQAGPPGARVDDVGIDCLVGGAPTKRDFVIRG